MWRGGAHVVVSIVDRVEHLHELSGCPAAAMEVQDLRDDLSCANYVARWPCCELALHSRDRGPVHVGTWYASRHGDIYFV